MRVFPSIAVLAIGSMFHPLIVHAHGGAEHEAVDVMNCAKPPESALRTLPPPLPEFARLECSIRGQFLMAADGWTWRYPASWFDRPLAPAWTPDVSRQDADAKYFVELSVETLSGDAVAAPYARLKAAVPAYGGAYETPPPKLYRVSAENNLGHDMEFWFPEHGPGQMWAILCAPDCRPEFAFMIHKP
ncbi:MAG: hypothetical protein KIT73_20825 [Burkholderiales bacterium]|nr:hypothetical protein [Burkholderiales bacterium]